MRFLSAPGQAPTPRAITGRVGVRPALSRTISPTPGADDTRGSLSWSSNLSWSSTPELPQQETRSREARSGTRCGEKVTPEPRARRRPTPCRASPPSSPLPPSFSMRLFAHPDAHTTRPGAHAPRPICTRHATQRTPRCSTRHTARTLTSRTSTPQVTLAHQASHHPVSRSRRTPALRRPSPDSIRRSTHAGRRFTSPVL